MEGMRLGLLLCPVFLPHKGQGEPKKMPVYRAPRSGHPSASRSGHGCCSSPQILLPINTSNSLISRHRHVFLTVTTSPTRGPLKPPHPQMHRLAPFLNKMARGGAGSRSYNPVKPPSKSSPKMALPFPLPATEDSLGVPHSLSASEPRKPGKWEISCLEWVEIDPQTSTSFPQVPARSLKHLPHSMHQGRG